MLEEERKESVRTKELRGQGEEPRSRSSFDFNVAFRQLINADKKQIAMRKNRCRSVMVNFFFNQPSQEEMRLLRGRPSPRFQKSEELDSSIKMNDGAQIGSSVKAKGDTRKKIQGAEVVHRAASANLGLAKVFSGPVQPHQQSREAIKRR